MLLLIHKPFIYIYKTTHSKEPDMPKHRQQELLGVLKARQIDY